MTKPFDAIVPAIWEPVYEGYCYAPAVLVGDDVHLSGLIGTNLDHSIPVSLDEQISNIFSYMEIILESAGCSFGDVFSLTSYHVGDLHAQMSTFITAQASRLGKPHPAWTAVGVAGLAMPGALLEVSVIARRRSHH